MTRNRPRVFVALSLLFAACATAPEETDGGRAVLPPWPDADTTDEGPPPSLFPGDDAAPSRACVAGAMRECFTGPPATLGRGACRAGRQTCDYWGRWPEGCYGQGLPTSETCDGQDNDCDGQVDDEAPCGDGERC